jgi:transposase-like protein
MSSFSSTASSMHSASKAGDFPSRCPACQSSAIATTDKKPDADSYWRCSACGEIWNRARRSSAYTAASVPWR